jgi:hypothetical protein
MGIEDDFSPILKGHFQIKCAFDFQKASVDKI